MDSHGYGSRLAIPDPPKTHTHDTGLTGIMGVAELHDQVTASCNDKLHHQPQCQTAATTTKDEMVGMQQWGPRGLYKVRPQKNVF